jgi:UDP-N-acetyl-2-amino-2-deoxyglucuronate dehydrogenase
MVNYKTKKMNFGLIGVSGFIAPRHLKAIKETNNKLIVGYDINDSVGIMDSFFPDSNFFKDFNEFDRFVEAKQISEDKLDYISICSPNYLHYPHIKYSLRTDVDVICEKPLVLTLEDLDKLMKEEANSGKRVFTILQLRLHPTIISLKEKISNNKNKKEVDLVYITSRGKWYHKSWKGEKNKSGGIAMNIGIHFFDMLSFVFGNFKDSKVNYISETKASGILELENARVRWFLSIDENDLKKDIRDRGIKTYRSIMIDGEELEFSDGFTDLHTQSYQSILNGNGFSLEDSRNSIEMSLNIMSSSAIGLKDDYHPYLKNVSI